MNNIDEKPASIFSANKKKSIDERLLKSINIKKVDPIEDDFKENPIVKEETPNAHTTLSQAKPIEDGRKSNQRPSLSIDENFFSVADKQARISMYLKILVRLVDELNLIQPRQMSILGEEKWNFNSDSTIPKIANSFNGILIQILEDFISNKSEREQEIFLAALKKAVDKER